MSHSRLIHGFWGRNDVAPCTGRSPLGWAAIERNCRARQWQQPGPTQVGPAIQAALRHGELSVERILGAVGGIDPGRPGVLLHYSDPFVLRARPLR